MGWAKASPAFRAARNAENAPRSARCAGAAGACRFLEVFPLCCATPLGLDAWVTGTQGRRSCLAPTLGFVVERRWRSMPFVLKMPPAFTARSHQCRERQGARTAPRTPRAFAQQRSKFSRVCALTAPRTPRAFGRCCECQGTRTGAGNAKGVRTAKGRVGELASLPCLLRPMHINPNGVAHDAFD
jgi:hypothetical protein